MPGCRISYLWDDSCATRGFATGVSLHSHTNQSKETLDFLANLGSQLPLIRPLLKRAERYCEERQHIKLDYARSYWTPPLTPKVAFELEGRQIENLDLAALVSITDHDTISAPMLLRTVSSARHIPVSTEWTIPFGTDQAFHLGIHNLPSESGASWMRTFEEFTARPSNARLTEMLAALSALPNVLIIFNHPLWDLYLIGEERHRALVEEFISTNAEFIHALELNGLRSWEENRAVTRMAKRWGKLLISGGDRHGVEPNANINLSNATSFTEFVHEVRYEGVSNILFMPQYAEPWKHRILQSTLDAVRYYPDFPQGSRQWDERVFHPDCDGVVRPLSEIWRDGIIPPVMHYLLQSVKILGSKAISESLRLAWTQSSELRFASEEQEAY